MDRVPTELKPLLAAPTVWAAAQAEVVVHLVPMVAPGVAQAPVLQAALTVAVAAAAITSVAMVAGPLVVLAVVDLL